MSATFRYDPKFDLSDFDAEIGPYYLQHFRFGGLPRLTGHLVRYMVQCMGGEIDKKDVDVMTPSSNFTRVTRYRPHIINITLICHSNGQFSVGKNMGGFNGSRVFKTREDADVYAIALQEKAGGPSEARIIVHDLSKKN